MLSARLWLWAGILGALMVLAGCSDDVVTQDDSTQKPGGTTGTTGAQGTLSDGQILRVLLAVNEGEVTLSQVGLEQASSPAVRDFNTRMVDEHTAANQRLFSLLRGLSLVAEETSVSLEIRAEVEQLTAAVRQAPAEDFDLALMDAQVAIHARAALVGDSLLTPQVSNPDLARELRTQREAVQQHLQDAAAIQDGLFQ